VRPEGPVQASGRAATGLDLRLRLPLVVVALALALVILVALPGGRMDAAPLVVAISVSLYLLRGSPLTFLALPFGAVALALTLLMLGRIVPSSIPVAAETGLAMALALVAARRLRLERLAEEESLSLLEARVLELREMTLRDPLTGLYNRRYVSEAGRGLVFQSRRYGSDIHALMIDIDHFKRVNDELGHPKGDEVLRGIASILRVAIRESDMAARIGGEEFLVLLPKAGAESAHNIANRIRDLVGATTFEGVPWPVTVSLGVTGIREGEDYESLVERADSYLYQSKRSGRNRVSGS
jgi:diguanylate cyclase (GGDEF)-like protein